MRTIQGTSYYSLKTYRLGVGNNHCVATKLVKFVNKYNALPHNMYQQFKLLPKMSLTSSLKKGRYLNLHHYLHYISCVCDRVPSSVSLSSEDLENTNSVGYIKGISVYTLYSGETQIQRSLARGALISLQLN